jgi:hypothetical protein
MFSFFKKPKPVSSRRVLDIETVRLLLKSSIKNHIQTNYRDIWSKEKMATISSADVEDASRKSFMPWSKNRWECEDQARALVDAAQRKAANEGMTWAIGVLHSDGPGQILDGPRHVYVWAVIASSILFFDPTSREWCDIPNNIYFSLA